MDEQTKNPEDILANLLRQLPEEELPASFRLNVMQQISRETVKVRRRNEWWGWAAVIAASLGMLGIAAGSLFYYMGMPEISCPKITWTAIHLPIYSFYLYIGLLTLVLLFLDYKFRKVLRKDE